MDQVGTRDRWTEEKLRKEIVALNARVDQLVKVKGPTWSDYSLRLALGLLALIAVAFVWRRRKPKPVPLQPVEDRVEEDQPVVYISARSGG